MVLEKKKIHKAEIVQYGDAIVLPDKMSLKTARDLIDRKIAYEEEPVNIIEMIGGFPYDGARAMTKAMEQMFGFAMAEPTPGFFGDEPPQLIQIEVAYQKYENIVWGQFSLPGFEGRVATSQAKDNNGRLVFQLTASTKRKYEKKVRALAQLTREILAKDSIYRGQAVKIRFRKDDGAQLPLPKISFVNLADVNEKDLVYPDFVQSSLETNIWTLLERREEVRAMGVPTKRGILLAGTFGVGKTAAAAVTAKKCVENGVTYLLCERADEFPEMVSFAGQYSPAVVFSEDIDRVTSGERSVSLDQILNIIDGVESKTSDVMFVLTTNNLEQIHKGMIRPGRLDAVIVITAPDAKAVERLVRIYGRGLVNEDEDLTKIGKLLAGQIPAVIREVVERSKLFALKNTPKGEPVQTITDRDLMESAQEMKAQIDLLNKPERRKPTDLERLGTVLGDHLTAGLKWAVRRTEEDAFPLLEPHEEEGFVAEED
jgi:transitional endoplasmic reticulum ATPase